MAIHALLLIVLIQASLSAATVSTSPKFRMVPEGKRQVMNVEGLQLSEFYEKMSKDAGRVIAEVSDMHKMTYAEYVYMTMRQVLGATKDLESSLQFDKTFFRLLKEQRSEWDDDENDVGIELTRKSFVWHHPHPHGKGFYEPKGKPVFVANEESSLEQNLVGSCNDCAGVTCDVNTKCNGYSRSPSGERCSCNNKKAEDMWTEDCGGPYDSVMCCEYGGEYTTSSKAADGILAALLKCFNPFSYLWKKIKAKLDPPSKFLCPSAMCVGKIVLGYGGVTVPGCPLGCKPGAIDDLLDDTGAVLIPVKVGINCALLAMHMACGLAGALDDAINQDCTMSSEQYVDIDECHDGKSSALQESNSKETGTDFELILAGQLDLEFGLGARNGTECDPECGGCCDSNECVDICSCLCGMATCACGGGINCDPIPFNCNGHAFCEPCQNAGWCGSDGALCQSLSLECSKCCEYCLDGEKEGGNAGGCYLTDSQVIDAERANCMRIGENLLRKEHPKRKGSTKFTAFKVISTRITTGCPDTDTDYVPFDCGGTPSITYRESSDERVNTRECSSTMGCNPNTREDDCCKCPGTCCLEGNDCETNSNTCYGRTVCKVRGYWTYNASRPPKRYSETIEFLTTGVCEDHRDGQCPCTLGVKDKVRGSALELGVNEFALEVDGGAGMEHCMAGGDTNKCKQRTTTPIEAHETCCKPCTEDYNP